MKELDPLLHSQLRLAIISLLLSVGNLSVQIDKLSEAGYIEVHKEIVGKKPRTSCSLTGKGREALEQYVSALKEYIGEIF